MPPDRARVCLEAGRAAVAAWAPAALAAGADVALAAAARAPLARVRHEIIKPPRAWQGTPAEGLVYLTGLGMDRSTVALVADPAATGNRHRLVAEGDVGRLELQLDNRALADNPKSSALTALSLVRLVEHRVAPLVV